MKFRKRPVVIDAVQLLPENLEEMTVHARTGLLVDGQPELRAKDGAPVLLIPTLEGLMEGREGDWIIRGVHGELYPCKPDIFAKTHEPA